MSIPKTESKDPETTTPAGPAEDTQHIIWRWISKKTLKTAAVSFISGMAGAFLGGWSLSRWFRPQFEAAAKDIEFRTERWIAHHAASCLQDFVLAREAAILSR